MSADSGNLGFCSVFYIYVLYVDVSMTSVRHRTSLLIFFFLTIFLCQAIITTSADSGNLGLHAHRYSSRETEYISKA